MIERVVFLLEDNPTRLQFMLDVLAAILPRHHVHVEDDAQRAIAWLDANQVCADLISLDHDLDSVPRDKSPAVDHGCGRDVSNFLATRPPTCPVIVHTTNAMAGSDMVVELRRENWSVFRVYPYDEHSWVTKSWKQMIMRLIATGYIDSPPL